MEIQKVLLDGQKESEIDKKKNDAEIEKMKSDPKLINEISEFKSFLNSSASGAEILIENIKPLQEQIEKEELLLCKTCNKKYDKNEFKSASNGKILKTCSNCRNRNSIKKPEEIKKIFNKQEEIKDKEVEDFSHKIDKQIQDAENKEIFSRKDCIEKLKPLIDKNIDLNMMDDQELKDLRKKIIQQKIKIFDNVPKLIYKTGTIATKIVEDLIDTFIPNNAISLQGFTDDLNENEADIETCIAELIKSDNAYYQKILKPENRLLLILVLTMGKTIAKNNQKKKIIGN